MLVINIIALCVCGFIIGAWLLQAILSIQRYRAEKRTAAWLLQAILSIQRYHAEKRTAALNEELSVAKEYINTFVATVNEENYKLRTETEKLKLRLKAEEEAHRFWRNKWAELNNINTKGDNE